MTFKALQNLITNTTAYTAVGAAQIALPSSVIAMLTTQLAGGYYTSVAVTDGVGYEVMNIVGVTAGGADVERGIDGTVPVPLANGSQVRFVWTTAGIESLVPGAAVTLTGAGGTSVTGGPNYLVASPTYSAGSGIDIAGGPVNFTISASAMAGPPPPVTVTASGIAVATGGPTNYNIAVAAPNFVGTGGITITGTWPNITIANSAVAGGTVTGVVAGAGITITGTPSVLPTVSLSTVGPGAGTYGGITLNAYGQVTAISASTITNVSTTTAGVTIGTPSPGSVTVNIAAATHTVQGLVALAPNSATGSNDVANDTQAVTPKGINAVVTALTLTNTPARLSVAGNQNALVPTAYTNTISGFTIPVITLAAGKSALVEIYVEVCDPLSFPTVQAFGIALFDSSTLLAGVSNVIYGNMRQLKCLINGPFSSTLTVKTTPLSGTVAVNSYYASIIQN